MGRGRHSPEGRRGFDLASLGLVFGVVEKGPEARYGHVRPHGVYAKGDDVVSEVAHPADCSRPFINPWASLA